MIDTAQPLPDLLDKLGACDEAVEWAKSHPNLAEAWDTYQRPDWMLWILRELKYPDTANLRRVACWCARNTPLQDGRATWDLLSDERSRKAIEVAERHAAGQATDEELAAARNAALAAALAAAWDVAWDAAGAAQADAIREIIGNPWR